MPIYRIQGIALQHDGELLAEGQTIELDEPQSSPWLVEVKTTLASGQKADSNTDTESEDTPPAGDTAKAGKKGEGK
ncbi:hypothetical protein [Chromobacterium subtsugae]|uniref:hypothetical protein n=1 Tax=Chromobacterium subtsugae TaxID=251747 RepID=UPI00064174ED|nr:hypothetical protein [Chromobacterium subtsugae]